MNSRSRPRSVERYSGGARAMEISARRGRWWSKSWLIYRGQIRNRLICCSYQTQPGDCNIFLLIVETNTARTGWKAARLLHLPYPRTRFTLQCAISREMKVFEGDSERIPTLPTYQSTYLPHPSAGRITATLVLGHGPSDGGGGRRRPAWPIFVPHQSIGVEIHLQCRSSA